MTAPVVDPGSQKPPAAPSAGPQRPAPRPNGAPVKGGGLEAIKINVGRRPVRYPIQLRVNVSPAMAASLQRVCQGWGIPEGIGARIAITQFLAQQDPNWNTEQ